MTAEIEEAEEEEDGNVLELENFEALMISMTKKGIKELSTASEGSIDNGRPFSKEELFDQKRQAKIKTETKDIERLHLKKPVTRKGFIRFADYSSKLRMMDSAMFIFGLKLHRQEDHVKFYDADFLNTI